ncbi:hypothetical protein BU23DRAFT_595528 [Bimuria novae-zelandiae CBS 107.79]|uniref:BTB domain-containing protein n=1 Tax=Bimuria novae-zelandiae CBS 107.79 TaxID=1447943 RepID=A0A6A5VP24_9PLEO|nr:hypothetical protein BU23DRAFT_595528 [Bimuria novae-zelandiae CBS 107.79]
MEPTDKIIKLKVTKEAGDTKALNVHLGVLCKSSGFFQRAMKPKWTELREQPDIIDLAGYSVQTVSDYIKWLYSDNIQIKLYHAGEGAREKVAGEAEKIFVMLAEAYVFGEEIIDAKYKNALVKTVLAAIKSFGWNLGPNSVDIIYKGTPSTSPLRRLIADSVANQAHDDSEEGFGWMDYFDAYPREALVDAIKATVRARPRPGHGTYLGISSYLEEEKEEQGKQEENKR